MNHTLEEALRNSADDLTLDQPVAAVIARGDRLRRQRGRRLAAAGVTAVVVGAAALSVTLPQGSSPLPEATAAWGPKLVNVTGDDLAFASKECRGMLGGYGRLRLPAGTAPLAGDVRDDTSFLVYRVDDQVIGCRINGLSGRRRGAALSIGTWKQLAAGDHTEPLLLSFASDPSHHVSEAGGGIRVSDAVDRVEVTYAGSTLDATVDQGIAMFWLPDGGTEDDILELAVTTYDAAGTELSSGPAT